MTFTPAGFPLTIRPAHPQDAPLAVECYRLSMGEFADQMFGAVPGHPADDVLEDLYTSRVGRFSHRFAVIAECEGQAVGLLLAYSSSVMPRLDLEMGWQLISRFGLIALARLLWPLRVFGSVREAGLGEYYICSLAVTPGFQGRGIGSRLLAYADEQARHLGRKKCSLLVALDNDGARRLYERAGYRVIRTWQARLPDGRLDGTRRMVKMLVDG